MGRKDQRFDQQRKRKGCVILSPCHLISHNSTDEFYGGSAFGEGGLESLDISFHFLVEKKMGRRGVRLYTLQ